MSARRGRALSGAFVFWLLGTFAVFAMLLVLLGARAYQSTVAKTEAHADARVLENFIVNAVRADDARGAVSVETINGMDALHIVYDYDGEAYDKWIYCAEDGLYELFTAREFGFDAQAGEFICGAREMRLAQDGGTIFAEIIDINGERHAAQIALRCGQ